MEVVEVRVGGKRFKSFEAAMGELNKTLAAAPDRATPLIRRAVLETLQRVSAEMRKLHGSAWDGSVAHSNPNLFRRSGNGLASIERSIRTVGSGKVSSIVGSISGGDLSFHEEGGTIVPTKSKFLTIPLPAAMSSAGIPLRKRARDWPNTFVQKSRRGNLIIFRNDGGGRITPLYLLKSSVTIRPRLQMRQSFERQLPFFERRVFERLDAVFQNV